jgi:dsRNA-specific ribonuclease
MSTRKVLRSKPKTTRSRERESGRRGRGGGRGGRGGGRRSYSSKPKSYTTGDQAPKRNYRPKFTKGEKTRQFNRSNAYRTQYASRKEWEEALKTFLDATLKPILPDKKDRQKYLTEEAMDTWSAAFTHISVDPRQGYNYEVLEYLGDRALKWAFGKYINRRFPELDQDGLTGVETTYMSKTFQPIFAKRMGLAKYALLAGSYVPDDVQEDLFEAFMGALEKVSDQIVDGLGIINIYNFIVYFFNGYEFDLRGESGGIAKTRFTQIFTRFDVPGEPSMIEGMTEWIVTGDGGEGIYTIQATPKMIKLLGSKKPGRGFNIQLKSKILGQAQGQREKEVEKVAYQQALKTLRSYGITPETAKAMKQQADFFEPSIMPLVPALRKKLEAEGLSVAFFTTSKQKKTSTKRTISLNAEDEDGVSHRLGSITIEAGDDYTEAKRKLVEEYIGVSIEGPSIVEGPSEVQDATMVEKLSKSKRKRKPKTKAKETAKPSRSERLKELKKYKVTELKDVLRSLDLKVGGRKAELIDRILNQEY